ncbi:hypothetical protein [Burkholderia stagnalis]|uniref:hypothetical protein n=1 Tax=Burkholderia stagnalis TaxID=1503054 RepID=UPI000F55A90B|nr:hypothetical protein [Burkholderia stagnalis]
MTRQSKPSKAKTNVELIYLSWKISGRWKGVFKSFDFVLAVIVCALSYHFWWYGKWWEQVISVVPNVLGFTLGGFAIFLGFGSEAFKQMLAAGDDIDESPYISVSASFLYFTVLQLAALLIAFVANAMHFETPAFLLPYKNKIYWLDVVGSAFGYFVFLYSLILALRAALRIFRLSRWYALFLAQTADAPTPKDPTPKDPTPKDPTPKDPTPKDTTPKETTPKDTTPKDTTPKDPAPKDETPKDSTPPE